jgi:zinc D-Ala-D-Ala carboxypeptidase
MNLSKHVTRAEFERSETAINHGIPNFMNEFEIQRAILLCQNVFEPIRAYVGRPIRINSGFRSAALNRRIGGSRSSQHTLGEAMDLDLNDRELFEWILDNVEYDQIIAEFPQGGKASWFHISYRKGRNRKQALVATKQKGKTVYLPYSQAKHLLY